MTILELEKNLWERVANVVRCGYSEDMKHYLIKAFIKLPSRNIAEDGFGDYENWQERRVCEVGAFSEAEALTIAHVTDGPTVSFWAEEIK